jgi:hypothetical protein
VRKLLTGIFCWETAEEKGKFPEKKFFEVEKSTKMRKVANCFAAETDKLPKIANLVKIS